MKIISIKNHGYLDYITVLAFAAIHLLMTLLTAFPLGVAKVIPVKLHKIVETIVGPVLIILPWVCGFSENLTARYVYIAMG